MFANGAGFAVTPLPPQMGPGFTIVPGVGVRPVTLPGTPFAVRMQGQQVQLIAGYPYPFAVGPQIPPSSRPPNPSAPPFRPVKVKEEPKEPEFPAQREDSQVLFDDTMGCSSSTCGDMLRNMKCTSGDMLTDNEKNEVVFGTPLRALYLPGLKRCHDVLAQAEEVRDKKTKF